MIRKWEPKLYRIITEQLVCLSVDNADLCTCLSYIKTLLPTLEKKRFLNSFHNLFNRLVILSQFKCAFTNSVEQLVTLYCRTFVKLHI